MGEGELRIDNYELRMGESELQIHELIITNGEGELQIGNYELRMTKRYY